MQPRSGEKHFYLHQHAFMCIPDVSKCLCPDLAISLLIQFQYIHIMALQFYGVADYIKYVTGTQRSMQITLSYIFASSECDIPFP